jgi:hypothetical protein
LSGLNDRVAAMAAKIDATIDALVEDADTPEQVAALNEQRRELHALLLQRSFAEAMNGYLVTESLKGYM